jgi:hypothetical protein
MLEQTLNTPSTTDARIAELPEPVRRYLQHALPGGSQVTAGVRLRMTGRIKVGLWLPFVAEQDCNGRAFEWRARIGLGPLKPLEVVDRYANGAGSVTGTLVGRYELFHQADKDVDRSAAGRAALEAVFAPASLLPGRGVYWSVRDNDHIVATSYLGHEEIDVHLRIGARGELRTVSARRWGDIGKRLHGYLSFGGDMLAEQRFGDLVIPSRFSVGWRYGTSHYKPFFQARIRDAQPRRCQLEEAPKCRHQLN